MPKEKYKLSSQNKNRSEYNLKVGNKFNED